MQAEFIIGDKAVYPSQGVAEIIGIEKKEVFGRIQRFYVLQGLDSGLRILVPVDKADQVGLRGCRELRQSPRLSTRTSSLAA